MEKSGRFLVIKPADVPDINEHGMCMNRVACNRALCECLDTNENANDHGENERTPLQTKGDISVDLNESIFEV